MAESRGLAQASQARRRSSFESTGRSGSILWRTGRTMRTKDLVIKRATRRPHDWNPMALGERVDASDELVGQPLEQLRRGDRPAAVLGQEPPEILRTLQPRDVPIEVKPVDAVDVERDVVAE